MRHNQTRVNESYETHSKQVAGAPQFVISERHVWSYMLGMCDGQREARGGGNTVISEADALP